MNLRSIYENLVEIEFKFWSRKFLLKVLSREFSQWLLLQTFDNYTRPFTLFLCPAHFFPVSFQNFSPLELIRVSKHQAIFLISVQKLQSRHFTKRNWKKIISSYLHELRCFLNALLASQWSITRSSLCSLYIIDVIIKSIPPSLMLRVCTDEYELSS